MTRTSTTATPTLPPSSARVFLTDGGIETDLIHRRGLDLPHFAAFTLLTTEAGRAALRDYYGGYLAIAASSRRPLLLESATWRANPDWASLLGYSAHDLHELNRAAIELLHQLRAQWSDRVEPILVGGSMGPRFDEAPLTPMGAEQAAEYHRPQLQAFAEAGADLATAYTIGDVAEGAGIVMAAREVGLPVAISLTVETDGRLPSGATLGEAIDEVDSIAAPDYFLLNCAHPEHLRQALSEPGPWLERIAGLRANASRRSHEELDAAEDFDDGDPGEFAAGLTETAAMLPSVRIFGGCCGTDARHIEAVARLLEPR